MKALNRIFFCIIITFIFGCGSEAYYKDLNSGYYLSATDVKEDMALGYQDGEDGIGVIDATVFAVGQNNNFIIVKQHPRSFPNKPDKGIVNYYIIPLKTKLAKSADKSFYGPLSLNEFQQKKKNLNIKDIVFKDLE